MGAIIPPCWGWSWGTCRTLTWPSLHPGGCSVSSLRQGSPGSTLSPVAHLCPCDSPSPLSIQGILPLAPALPHPETWCFSEEKPTRRSLVRHHPSSVLTGSLPGRLVSCWLLPSQHMLTSFRNTSKFTPLWPGLGYLFL